MILLRVTLQPTKQSLSLTCAIITGGWSLEKEENVNGAQDVYNSLSKNHTVRIFTFDDTFSREKNRKITKIYKLGGLYRAAQVANLAIIAHIRCMIGSTVETAIRAAAETYSAAMDLKA